MKELKINAPRRNLALLPRKLEDLVFDTTITHKLSETSPRRGQNEETRVNKAKQKQKQGRYLIPRSRSSGSNGHNRNIVVAIALFRDSSSARPSRHTESLIEKGRHKYMRVHATGYRCLVDRARMTVRFNKCDPIRPPLIARPANIKYLPNFARLADSAPPCRASGSRRTPPTLSLDLFRRLYFVPLTPYIRTSRC